MVGYSAREKVVAQINKRITTSKDEKSKRALIVVQYRPRGSYLNAKQQLKSAIVQGWDPGNGH